jgi:hypothetical protein
LFVRKTYVNSQVQMLYLLILFLGAYILLRVWNQGEGVFPSTQR